MNFNIEKQELAEMFNEIAPSFLGSLATKNEIPPDWFQIIAYQNDTVALSKEGAELIFHAEKLHQAEEIAIKILFHQYHVEKVVFFSDRVKDVNGKIFRFTLDRQEGIARFLSNGKVK